MISGIMNKLKGGTYTAGAERERGNQEVNRQLKMAEPNWHKYQAALTAGGTTDNEMPDQITDWARRNFSQDGANPLMSIPDYASKFPGPLNDENVRSYLKLAAAKYLTRGGPRPASAPAPANTAPAPANTAPAPANTAPANATPTRVNYGGTSGTATLPQATPAQGAYSVRGQMQQTTPAQAAPTPEPAEEPVPSAMGNMSNQLRAMAPPERSSTGGTTQQTATGQRHTANAQPTPAPAQEPQGQALDLDQYRQDKAARLAAAQAGQQQAQQQMATTAQANAQTAAADNAKVAEVQAIKAKQERGELLSTAERNTLNLAAKSGIHETEYNLLRGKQIVQEAKKLQKKLTAIKKKKNETI